MKALIAVAFLIFPFYVLGANCPNFVGVYKSLQKPGEPSLILTLTQKECALLKARYDMGDGFVVNHLHTIDGKKRVVETGDDFIAYETCTIDPVGLRILEENRITSKDEPRKWFVKILFAMENPTTVVIKRDIYKGDGTYDYSTLSKFKRTVVKR